MVVADVLSAGVTVPVWAALAVLGGLFVAVGLGFAAGLVWARVSAQRELQHASGRLDELVALTLRRLDAAGDAVAAVQSFPPLRLADGQLDALAAKQSRLAEAFGQVVESRRAATVVKEPSREFTIDWLTAPEDATTGLPDRFAFEQNLQTLLARNTENNAESGVLLVQVDRFEQLTRRVGRDGAETVLKMVGRVVIRAVRDTDLVCRYGATSFGVLLPSTDAATADRLVEAVRETLRLHRFRLDADGPELLVTTCLGYSPSRPHENADLVFSRLGDALERSQRRRLAAV